MLLHRSERTHVTGNAALFPRLCAAAGIAYCSYAMCRSPVLPLFARHLGAGPQLVGLVVGASTITGVLVKLPAGALSDVLGRRALLTAGAMVFAFLPFAYLPVAGLAALLLLRFVHGNATAIFGPVASATLSDLAPADRRGRWLGTYAAVQGSGQTLAPVIAGYLISGDDFDRAFVVSGTLGLIALALIAGWPADRSARSAGSWWRSAVDGVRQVIADRRILTTSLAQAGQLFVNGCMNAFTPLFGREILGLSTSRVGLIFGVQTVTTLLAKPAFGALSDRVGRRPTIVAGLAICAAAVASISIAASFTGFLLAAGLYGAGVALTTSATSAYITDVAPRARFGAAHGVFGTIYDVGDASGPIVGGLLVGWIGYRGAFRLVAGGALGLAVLFALATRRRP